MGHWNECREGRNLEEKKSLFTLSSKEVNRFSGDLPRVMASFSSNAEAFNDYSFGKCAALCGENAMVETYNLKHVRHPNHPFCRDSLSNPFGLCVEGSCGSGDEECLETCLYWWKNVIQPACTDASVVEGHVHWVISWLIGCCNLSLIPPNTFGWISSKWSNNDIVEFIDHLPLEKLGLTYYFPKLNRRCCNRTNPRSSSLLMSFFGLVGHLKGFQWLYGMGVKSNNVIMYSLIGKQREIPENLLSTHRVSMCKETALVFFTQCSLVTFEWCVNKSLISCIEALIYECIREAEVIRLMIFLGLKVDIVTQANLNYAAGLLSYGCLEVLLRYVCRWNPSRCVVAMHEARWKFLKHFKFNSNCTRFVNHLNAFFNQSILFHRVGSLVYDWCKLRHIPFRRWNSQYSLQQVLFKGEVDQAGVVHSKGHKQNVVCTGNQICDYLLPGSASRCSKCNSFHSWMCNCTSLCSCQNKLGRRHSV